MSYQDKLNDYVEEHKVLSFLDDNKVLSDMTRIDYGQKAIRLMDLLDKDIAFILKHPDTYIEKIKRIYKNPRSQKVYISFLLAVFKYNPTFKEKNKDAYDVWYEDFKKLNEKVVKQTSLNQATKRQLDGYVDYPTFVKKLDTLPEGSKDRLLIAMYGLIEPLRSDFNAVKIYNTREPKNKAPNYIVMTKKGARMVLTEFKTARKMGNIEMVLPEALVKEIQSSLKHDPREWLFQSKNAPYLASTFNKWVNSRFKELYDKPLTISILRHAYVNTIDLNNTSEADREAIARRMGHSSAQQLLYRLLNTKHNPEDVISEEEED